MTAYQVLVAKPVISRLFPELVLRESKRTHKGFELRYFEPETRRVVVFKSFAQVRDIAAQRGTRV